MRYHLASLLPWPFPHYRTLPAAPPGPGLSRHRLAAAAPRGGNAAAAALVAALRAAARPLFLFAMQMETDYSIRAYSRFPDNDSAIAEAVASFARAAPAEAQLLVKVHPLDPGLKRWRRRIGRIAAAAGVAARVHRSPARCRRTR